jgi:hypothetical protein
MRCGELWTGTKHALTVKVRPLHVICKAIKLNRIRVGGGVRGDVTKFLSNHFYEY